MRIKKRLFLIVGILLVCGIQLTHRVNALSLVSEKASLKGLNKIAVLVRMTPEYEIGNLGISEASFQNKTELMLRMAGISVVKVVEGEALLEINITVVNSLEHPIYS